MTRRGAKLWMHALWPRRFIAQVTVLTLCVMALGIAVLSIYTTTALVAQQQRDTEQRLDAIASNLALGSARAVLIRNQIELENLLLHAADYPGLHGLAVIDASHRVLSEVRHVVGRPAEAVFDYRILAPPVGRSSQFLWSYGGRARGQPLALGLDATELVVWYPIENGQLGWLRIETGVDAIKAQALRVIEEITVVALATFILIAFALFWLLRPSLRAISAATDFAGNLASARGQQITVYSGSEEFAQLGLALNQTSSRLHAQDTALRDQAAHTQAVLNTVVDGILTFDASGVIASFNPAAERMFGYAPDELRGQSVTMLMFSDAPNPVSGMIGGGREVDGRRKDGSVFPMKLAVAVIQREGTPMYVGTVRDITERKRLDRLKNEFIAAVSHEIRTPMNAILGFTQLLGYDHNLTSTQKANLVKVRKAGDHLLSIVNDVLDLSRIEAGKVALSMEPVAVNDVLRECRNLTHAQAAERGMQVHLEEDDAADYCVRADRIRLRQVLLNLVSNAVKYNRPEGCVWLTCTPGAAGRIRISVRDNGPGIAPAKQAELFQPFNRLGAELGEIEGTGIGLTIAKQMVELMQGEIGMTSTPGQGCTFWVELAQDHSAPQVSRSALDIQQLEQPAIRTGQHTVLYVEDNSVNAEFVQVLCSQFWPNLNLLHATSAEIGLELAAAHNPELILMDVNLPGMNGYEALARLQADVALRHIPVVAVTANAMKSNLEEGRVAGFTDYLTKPINIPHFLAVLDRLLSKTSPQPSSPAVNIVNERQSRVLASNYLPIVDEQVVTAGVLDAHATRQLSDLLGARAAPIIDILLDDLPKHLELLQAAIERGDVAAVRHEAHTMKGSSSNLGASAFAQLCALLSTHCKSGELQRLPETCRALEREFQQRTAPALRKFRNELLLASPDRGAT